MRLTPALLALPITLLIATAAFAHPGHHHVMPHGPSGLYLGFTHPFFGLDHLLAMVAVGLWAWQLGGMRMQIFLPLTFLAVMALGSFVGFAGIALPMVEPMIVASVVALGLLIATTKKLPAPAAMGLVALFAFAHGNAHGAELASGASATGYVAGFLLATALLHGAGLALGAAIDRFPATLDRREAGYRFGGSLVAACGLVMIAGLF